MCEIRQLLPNSLPINQLIGPGRREIESGDGANGSINAHSEQTLEGYSGTLIRLISYVMRQPLVRPKNLQLRRDVSELGVYATFSPAKFNPATEPPLPRNLIRHYSNVSWEIWQKATWTLHSTRVNELSSQLSSDSQPPYSYTAQGVLPKRSNSTTRSQSQSSTHGRWELQIINRLSLWRNHNPHGSSERER